MEVNMNRILTVAENDATNNPYNESFRSLQRREHYTNDKTQIQQWTSGCDDYDKYYTASNESFESDSLKEDVLSLVDIEWCEQPSKNCVVLGRGGKINKMEGNRRFLRLSRGELRQQYKRATTTEEKYNISLALVAAVHQSGGRFLDYDKVMQMYYTVPDKRARYKASAALREPYETV
jgi:hypothetical protein